MADETNFGVTSDGKPNNNPEKVEAVDPKVKENAKKLKPGTLIKSESGRYGIVVESGDDYAMVEYFSASPTWVSDLATLTIVE